MNLLLIQQSGGPHFGAWHSARPLSAALVALMAWLLARYVAARWP